MIEHNTGSYVLCSLLKDKLYQQPLNLEFAAGEEISFVVHGTGQLTCLPVLFNLNHVNFNNAEVFSTFHFDEVITQP